MIMIAQVARRAGAYDPTPTERSAPPVQFFCVQQASAFTRGALSLWCWSKYEDPGDDSTMYLHHV